MPDQIYMQWVYPFRRRNSCEDGMSLICSHFWAYEPQAMSRPIHMRINWHNRKIKVKHEYARRSFWSYTRNITQVLPSFFRCKLCQFVIQVIPERLCSALFKLFFGQRKQSVLNANSFDIGEPSGTNGFC